MHLARAESSQGHSHTSLLLSYVCMALASSPSLLLALRVGCRILSSYSTPSFPAASACTHTCSSAPRSASLSSPLAAAILLTTNFRFFALKSSNTSRIIPLERIRKRPSFAASSSSSFSPFTSALMMAWPEDAWGAKNSRILSPSSFSSSSSLSSSLPLSASSSLISTLKLKASRGAEEEGESGETKTLWRDSMPRDSTRFGASARWSAGTSLQGTMQMQMEAIPPN